MRFYVVNYFSTDNKNLIANGSESKTINLLGSHGATDQNALQPAFIFGLKYFFTIIQMGAKLQ